MSFLRNLRKQNPPELLTELPAEPTKPARPAEPTDPTELDKQIKRLSKELYRWNTLVESQTEQTRTALEGTQNALAALSRERAASSKSDGKLIKALFSVLDNVEIALASGMAQIEVLRESTPEAAAMLAAWLEGQRLLLERLLTLLEAEGVKPIATIGLPFDPYRHIAIKTDYDPSKAAQIILAEERRGYSRGEDVLRFAEVVVNKAQPNNM